MASPGESLSIPDIQRNPPTPTRSVRVESGSVRVESGPPAFVRTRRPFTVVLSAATVEAGTKFSASLVYADDLERVSSGTARGRVVDNARGHVDRAGQVHFPSLRVNQSSACELHGHRPFRLAFRVVGAQPDSTAVVSAPFVAYSHSKVLARLRQVSLQCMAPTQWTASGAHTALLVGGPFVATPSFNVRFRVVDAPPMQAAPVVPDSADTSPLWAVASDMSPSPQRSLEDGEWGWGGEDVLGLGTAAGAGGADMLDHGLWDDEGGEVTLEGSDGFYDVDRAVEADADLDRGHAVPSGADTSAESLWVAAEAVELVNKTVVKFRIPECPISVGPGETRMVHVEATNDGEHYSNAISFLYIGEAGAAHKRPRCML